MKKSLKIILLVLVLLLIGWTVVANYSFIFSKKVMGEIVEVDRVAQPDMIFSGKQVDPALIHSFAVAVKDESGEIFTSSSQDSDWAAAKKGMCVQARFFPVPPWDFERAGTYLNVRILQLRDCK
jgi:hypothetical protein